MNTEELIKKFQGYGERFCYMMLDRLRSDCDYFLGYGCRNEGVLWADNVERHIAIMRALWDSFPDDRKPQWLTREQIDEYEQKMSRND